jgi:conjugative transposon TraJ protein
MDFENIHQILRSLYADMMPLCSDMIGIAKGIAGLGALIYVAYRVWQSIARAEPIDVFPLLRPFAIGLCIMFFPSLVLGTINSVLSPVVSGTHQILQSQTLDMRELAKTKDQLEIEIKKRNKETAYLVDQKEFDKKLSELGILDAPEIAHMYFERALYDTKKWIQQAFRNVLEMLFNAAALIIDVIRTFFLIVLSILGPIAFGIAVYDGFGATLVQWLTRYIAVYLWLPVSDLFSCILAKLQSSMLASDIARMQADPAYALDFSDAIYAIFLLIGIVGFFTVPTVAGWIIQAGGLNNYNRNVGQAATKGGLVMGGAASRGGSVMSGLAGAAAGNIAGRLKQRNSSGNGSQPEGRNYAASNQSGNSSSGSQAGSK